MAIELSILIASYNTRDMTLACLNSVYAQAKGGHEFEVIVVDNDSPDGSAEAIARQYPHAKLVLPGENLGFARANNLAAQHATGRYLLLLNPDTVVLDHAIDRLFNFAIDQGGGGIYGGRTLFADRTLNPSSCWSAPSLWGLFCVATGMSRLLSGVNLFNPDSMPEWKRDSCREVDIVSGCFLLVSRAVWEKLHGFDRAFRMYAEEFDFCLRAKKAGIQCFVTPEAEIIHYGGASEKSRSDKMCRLFETKVLLINKHWSPLRAWSGRQLLKVWVISRIMGASVLAVFQKGEGQSETWRSIWRCRKGWLKGSVDD